MMMLAAIILIIGFIALAGMVSRVGQLGVQTEREQKRPLLLEVSPMKVGLDGAIASLLSPAYGYRTDTDAHKLAYEQAITGVIEHMRTLEQSRGFLLEYRLACATAGDPTTGYAGVSLTDGDLWLQQRTATFVRAPVATLTLARTAASNIVTVNGGGTTGALAIGMYVGYQAAGSSGMAVGTTIASITDATHFTISASATSTTTSAMSLYPGTCQVAPTLLPP